MRTWMLVMLLAALFSIVLGAAARAIAQDPVTMDTGRRYFAYDGDNARSLILGDWDEDGATDALTTDIPGDVRLHRGDGFGNFAPGEIVATGPTRLADSVADLDGDGHLDALGFFVRVGTEPLVMVLLGDGAGGFVTTAEILMPSFALGAIRAADLDGNGYLDIAATIPQNGTLAVALADGLGGYGAPVEFFLGSLPIGLLLTDLDGDSNIDALATQFTAGTGGVTFLKGNGAGGFAPPVFTQTFGEALGVAAADFDGDTDLDIVVTHNDENEVVLLDGDGTGNFANQRTLPEFLFEPSTVRVRDFDGDGVDDLGVQHRRSGGDRVAIYRGLGAGTFAFLDDPSPGPSLRIYDTDDLDGDGRLDIVALTERLVVIRGTGKGTFRSAVSLDTGGTRIYGSVVADFNGDGAADVAVTREGLEDVAVFLGSGFGSFSFASSFVTGTSARGLVAEDFDGDGHLDLAVTNVFEDTITVVFGDGAGGFSMPADYVAGIAPVAIVALDANEDGAPDLAIANSGSGCPFPDCSFDATFTIFLNDGAGGFVFFGEFAKGDTSITRLGAGDFNEDGHLDLVVRGRQLRLSLFFGDGTGSFTLGGEITSAANADGFAIEDLDGDGSLDLAVTQFEVNENSFVAVHRGNGNGTFAPPMLYEVFEGARAVVAADFNGDGTLDLAAGSLDNDVPNGPVTFLVQNEAAEFERSADLGAGNGVGGLAAADFDGDGTLDVLVQPHLGADLWLLLNRRTTVDTCRIGNVDAGVGAPVDVLFVNGSAGIGAERRVMVDASSTTTVAMNAPPSRPAGPSRFALYARRGSPGPEQVTLLPARLGVFCTPTFLTDYNPHRVLRTWNNIGKENLLGAPDAASTPAPSTVFDATIGISIHFILQGIIVDSDAPNERAAVTNAVLVEAMLP